MRVALLSAFEGMPLLECLSFQLPYYMAVLVWPQFIFITSATSPLASITERSSQQCPTISEQITLKSCTQDGPKQNILQRRTSLFAGSLNLASTEASYVTCGGSNASPPHAKQICDTFTIRRFGRARAHRLWLYRGSALVCCIWPRSLPVSSD